MSQIVPDAHSSETDALRREFSALCETDNRTNWFFIGRAWGLIAAAVGAAVCLHRYQIESGLSPWWLVPVALFVILVVGACQHQLGNAGHEAVHFLLFKNRILNELVSDWFCMFPIFITTQQFRIHHFAHHRHVNDSELDPVRLQLRESDQWLDFPIKNCQFFIILLRTFLPWNSARYTLTRARYNALSGSFAATESAGVEASTGNRSTVIRNRGAQLTGVIIPAYILIAPAIWLIPWPDSPLPLRALVFVTVAAAFLLCAALVPGSWYPRDPVRPVLAARSTALQRILYLTLLFGSLAWLDANSTLPVWVYFFLFWITPLFTSFAAFMILRELIQHGNHDRGRYSNSGVHYVNPLVRFAVFPFGNEYHLPHHLHPSVPHFRLGKLHKLLLRENEYANGVLETKGWIRGADSLPSIMATLGPEYAPRNSDIFIDNDILPHAEIRSREEEDSP